MRPSALLLVPLLLASCTYVAREEPRDAPRPMQSSASVPAKTAAPTAPAAAVAVAATPSDILPYKATETTLANGLKVIVVPTGMPNLVSLQIPVQTGSRNEVEPGKTGFAHFFEHMMFRGTAKYPPEKYEAIITKAGARQNAYTTDDYTNYHVTFAKEDLEKILEIEADRFQNLAYTEEQFRTEARAVLGEYLKNAANPLVKLEEIVQDAAFTTHTYKHTTMGFLADIQAMPDQLAYAKVFFERWYRPEYATVIVAGDVDAAQVLALVEKYWGGWKRGSFKAEIPQEGPPRGPVYAHLAWDEQTSPYVTVAFHGPAFSETAVDSVALDVLQELYFGSTSELYKKLVLDEQKVDELDYSNAASQDPSLATIYAKLRDTNDAVYVRDQILATCARARAEKVDPARLAEAKANNRYGTSRAFDNTDTIAGVLARFVRFRRSYDTLNNLFRLYDSLTPEDLRAAGAKYYQDAGLVVATVSQAELAAEIATPPALASFAVAAPQPTRAPRIELANPSRQLTFKLQFQAGSAHDPAGKEGLAALSAALITEGGSSARKLEEIEKILFPIAGGFGAFVDRETTTFNASIHADNLTTFFDAVLPQLTSPGWRAEDFERVKQAARTALVNDLRLANAEELGKEVLQTSLFAGSSYGHPTQGTVAGIEAITLEDVQNFVAEHYTQAALVVGLAGDVPPAGKAYLLAELGRLPPGAVVEPKPKPVAHRPVGVEVEIVEKESSSTAISIGHPIDIVRGSPDFVALYLARTWLGEHRSSLSHLYQRIREVRGMNYGDYAYIEAFRNGGSSFFAAPNQTRRAQLFEMWIRPVKPENAQHALRIALHELDKLIEHGLSQEDFENTREYLSKNVFLLTASQSQQLGAAFDSKSYGTSEYTKYMRDGLAKLTLADVNAAIKRHLSAKNVYVVCITKDAAGLKQQLLADGPSSMTYESAKSQELLDDDKLIGARKLAIAPDKLRIVPVDAVFAK